MIDPRAWQPLDLDTAAIAARIPHRPPLLLLDGATALAHAPPALRAHKQVRADEPVLAGHFPGRPVWPGAYTIEGLAQACALLGALRSEGPPPRAAWLAAAQVKLTAPVEVGARLDYLVLWTFAADALQRFDVEASVADRVVAKGTLTLAVEP